jgi:integrase
VDNDLVFATRYGTELDAANVRRAFRSVAAAAGLEASEWTPRELRHSFVSLLSSSGVPIEDIAHLVGHASTNVTEKVYRKELRPVLTRGATAMDACLVAVELVGQISSWISKTHVMEVVHASKLSQTSSD